MFNLVALSEFRGVCLYLPSLEASRQLENILKSEDVAALCVATPPEFRKAVPSNHSTAIVTVFVSGRSAVTLVPIIFGIFTGQVAALV